MQSFLITVSPNFQKTATYFFNATIEDIFNELAQNSRRAGATELLIRLFVENNGKLWVSVEDDGCGIFTEDFEGFQVGSTGWTRRIKDQERPAGCGLFSLARQEEVEIFSGKYKLKLIPEHFKGIKTCIPEELDTGMQEGQGTVIRFRVDQFPPCDKRCGYYWKNLFEGYPVDVTVLTPDGYRLFVKRKSFIPDDAFKVIDCRGLKIACVSTPDPRFNFYGLTIKHDLPTLTVLKNNLYMQLSCIVDVINCPSLEFVLPSRKEVIKNAFYYELIERCRKLIFEAIAEHPELVLHKRDHFFQAQTLGIDLSANANYVEKLVCPVDEMEHNPYTDWSFNYIPYIGGVCLEDTDTVTQRWLCELCPNDFFVDRILPLQLPEVLTSIEVYSGDKAFVDKDPYIQIVEDLHFKFTTDGCEESLSRKLPFGFIAGNWPSMSDEYTIYVDKTWFEESSNLIVVRKLCRYLLELNHDYDYDPQIEEFEESISNLVELSRDRKAYTEKRIREFFMTIGLPVTVTHDGEQTDISFPKTT